MSLKVKMILMFILTAVISIGSIASFGIVNISNETRQNINTNMSSTVGSYVNGFNGWIEKNSKVAESTNDIISNVTDGTDIDIAYLQAYKEKSNSSSINDLYAGFENGKYVDGSGWVPSGI